MQSRPRFIQKDHGVYKPKHNEKIEFVYSISDGAVDHDIGMLRITKYRSTRSVGPGTLVFGTKMNVIEDKLVNIQGPTDHVEVTGPLSVKYGLYSIFTHFRSGLVTWQGSCGDCRFGDHGGSPHDRIHKLNYKYPKFRAKKDKGA